MAPYRKPAPPVTRRVSKRQAAIYAGVHRDTIQRLVDRGVLTVHVLGPKCHRVDLDELDAIMANGGERPAS